MANDRISVEIDIVEEKNEFDEMRSLCIAMGVEFDILSYSGVNGWPVCRLTGPRDAVLRTVREVGYDASDFLELEPHRRS